MKNVTLSCDAQNEKGAKEDNIPQESA